MANKKGKTNWAQVLMVGGIVGIFALLSIALFFGGNIQTALTGQATTETGDEDAYSYVGKNVKHTLETTDRYTADSLNPTFYLYEEEPNNWGNGRQSIQDGYVSTYTSSDGTATVKETPGTYFVRADLSNYYDKFFQIEVPKSGEVPLTDYNDAGGEITKVKMINVSSLSTSNLDLGISTNVSTDKMYTARANFDVSDNKGYRLDEMVFKEDGTYSFATDTDSDGIYDEGVNKVEVIINGETHTLFDVSSSIDEFSGDDQARVDISDGELSFKEYAERGVVSFDVEVTCDETNTNTGDGDEKCGDGEDFLDSIVLVDSEGNTQSVSLQG